MVLNISGTLEHRNQVQAFPAFLRDHWPPLQVGSNAKCIFVPWVQRLPRFDQVIAMSKKELDKQHET
jgi:hypothetical protein